MLSSESIPVACQRALADVPVWDLHTHLYPPSFGTPLGRGATHDPTGLMLWGIDELLTYHYLVAEVLRATDARETPTDRFLALPKREQADVIWRELFVRRTPLSEACRGVVTTLTRLGLDPHDETLDAYRNWFAERSPDDHLAQVLALAGVERVTMTNDLFDDNERARWLANPRIAADPRFPAVLRFDPLVVDWPSAAKRVASWGYTVNAACAGESIESLARLLDEWIARMRPVYCAMSLPPTWRYPLDGSAVADQLDGQRVLTDAILPACARHGLPLGLMIGVTRRVNPALQAAGDSVGPSDVDSIARLCRDFPQQSLLVTTLAREDQHALAVAARKFRNLRPFGCWWFLNNPSLIEETTRLRVELLGHSFVPQHSDARVLEQLLYKWDHSRQVIARVLADKYADLARAGWRVTDEAIRADAHALLRGNVEAWIGGAGPRGAEAS
ncbi:MAG: hypothetical protein ACRCT8_06750 [Lacipirellulaceae bacterium]